MRQIVEVPILSRNALIPLFESNIRDRASIDCVLEGHFGTARADSLAMPTVARVDCGPFTAFAGDAAASAVADLIGRAPVRLGDARDRRVAVGARTRVPWPDPSDSVRDLLVRSPRHRRSRASGTLTPQRVRCSSTWMPSWPADSSRR